MMQSSLISRLSAACIDCTTSTLVGQQPCRPFQPLDAVFVAACAALHRGDRVVVAFDIACGQCFFCNHGYQSSCDTTNPSKVRCRIWQGHFGALSLSKLESNFKCTFQL